MEEFIKMDIWFGAAAPSRSRSVTCELSKCFSDFLRTLLRTYISGVNAPRDSSVRRALHDHAAVWKHGELIGWIFKPQRELIGPNRSQRRETRGQIP